MITSQKIDPENRRLWWAALKPPMYSVAIVPILAGTTVSRLENHQIDWLILSIFLSSAICLIAWINLTNDVFDADTGIDRNKPHSVVNLTGNKPLVFTIANGFLLLGILGIVAIASWSQNPWVILLIGGACFLGYTYQGPPFRLGYQGWGELICFVTFGPMTIAAVIASQNAPWTGAALSVSLFVGLSTAIILFCSHFHQVDDDLAAGKRSPIVRLGTAPGATVLTLAIAALFAIVGVSLVARVWPTRTLLVFLSVPIGYHLSRHVHTFHDQPQQVKNCKFIAVKLHFWSGILLSLSLGLTL